MNTALSRSWIDLLASIVPMEPDVGLLQALLWEGEAARVQWKRWTEAVGDPKAFFERESLGRKGLLAFVATRIGANAMEVDHQFATYARVARVREELRGKIFIERLQAVQSAMEEAGLQPILINGAAYAFTVYADPLLRHNHGIDLLVSDDALDDALAAAAQAGFRMRHGTRLPQGMLTTHRHGSGLELTLRSRLFLAPHIEADATALRIRCREIDIGAVRARVLDPVDMLCHTLGETASAPARRNLRWVCDAFLLLTRDSRFDHERLLTEASQLGIALPTSMLLEFLLERLSAPIPPDVIRELRASGAPRDRRSTNLLLSMSLRSSTSVDGFVARAVRARGGVLGHAVRFALLPSAEHIAYQARPGSTDAIPLLHARRMTRFLLRPVAALRRVTRRAWRTSATPAPSAGKAVSQEIDL